MWQQTTRTTLIIQLQKELGGKPSNDNCKLPVSLIDIYPTLVDLCGLPKNQEIEGRSIVPLLRNPQTDWPYPALITHSPHWHGSNHAVRSEKYYYIQYNKGAEELYDMSNDSNQLHNLATDSRYAETKKKLKKWIPKKNAPHFRPKK